MKKKIMYLFAALMTVALSIGFTSCSDDDDDDDEPKAANVVKADGTELQITNAVFEENEEDGYLDVYLDLDGGYGLLFFSVSNDNLGKQVDMTQPTTSTLSWETVDFETETIWWYGSNWEEDDEFLASGSWFKVERGDNNTFSVTGNLVFEGEKNKVEDGQKHVVTVNFNGTATEYKE